VRLLVLGTSLLVLAGCSSSSDDPASRGATPSSTAPGAGSSTSAGASNAPAVPTLTLDTRGSGPSSACVKGTRGGRVASWQPTFTARGGDIEIRRVRVDGRGVTLFEAQGVVVDPTAGGPSTADDLAWPVQDTLLPENATSGTRGPLVGSLVEDGQTILPILGIDVQPSSDPRGAHLTDVTITYVTGAPGGRATVTGIFDVSWPRPGGRCT